MDPLIEQRLEKLRERKQQLQGKLQNSPMASTRKRKPLSDNDANANPELTTIVPDLSPNEQKRRRSSPNQRRQGSPENQPDQIDSRQAVEKLTNTKATSPPGTTRRGRLHKLAQQINDWEDDLSHPQIRKETPAKKVWQPPKPQTVEDDIMKSKIVNDNTRPPKPPRAQQESPASTRNNRPAPFVPKASSAQKQTIPSTQQPPATTPRQQVRSDDPVQKPVSARFAMWEQKTNDSLTPLRNANPLPTGVNSAIKTTSASNVTPVRTESQTSESEFRPTRSNTRRRSRSANAGTSFVRDNTIAPATVAKSPAPRTPRTGPNKTTPQNKTAHNQHEDENWNKKQDQAFQQAPMSARKMAWEAKIAEQQNVATEHNRIMYRSPSATRLESAQKQNAEKSLARGQEKEYDPAEKARLERQAELQALSSRFDNKGLLASETKRPPTPAQRRSPRNHQPEPAAQQAQPVQMRKQVSFKNEDEESQERKPRRLSCRIPSLGYQSSSDDEDSPNTQPIPVPNIFEQSVQSNSVSRKLPGIADESSMDDLDDDMSRQYSGSSISTTQSSASYTCDDDMTTITTETDHIAGNEIDDLLDEAMSEEEEEITPVIRSPVKQTNRRSPRISKHKSANMLHSVDSYRNYTKSQAKLKSGDRGVRVSNFTSSSEDMETDDTYSQSSGSGMSENERRKKIRKLQDEVQVQQAVITQTSNALSHCQTGSCFNGSQEQVECNRVLLMACQRRQTCLAEIEKIKSNRYYTDKISGKGSLTISDLQLPLKRDFVKRIGAPDDTSVHYFVLMLRDGAQLIVTEMVSTHGPDQHINRGVLHFPNLIKLSNLMNDFKYELQIYSMRVERELCKTPSKRDKKKTTLSRNKSLAAGKENSSHMTQKIQTTNFTHISSLFITMDSVQHNSFQIKVPYMSVLQGTIHMTMRCMMEANVVHRGFINMYEEVGGFGAWHRRWCVLNNNTLSYWKYPDDERVKDAIGEISLRHCATREIGLVSRDKCARPNTIEVLIQINDARKPQYEQFWFGMDTKNDRLEWSCKLNESLANVRQWYSDAARPV